jgi:hypothetical protein
MNETLQKPPTKPLSPGDKAKIWDRIGTGWMADPDERNPLDVIKEDFDGNEEAYLRRMAAHLGIPLD